MGNLVLMIDSADNGPHAGLGVPENQTALIMRIGGRWKLLRTIEETSGGWKGSFDSPEDALASLKDELSAETGIAE